MPNPEGIKQTIEIFTPDPIGEKTLQAWLLQHWGGHRFSVAELDMARRVYESQGVNGPATLVERGWAIETEIARGTTPTRRRRLEAVLSAYSLVLWSEGLGGILPGRPSP